MYSCSTKIIYKLTFPIACLEQFLRAIWNAVSWAIVLILPWIKYNSTVMPFFFFFQSACHKGKLPGNKVGDSRNLCEKVILVLDSFCMSGSDSKGEACNAGSPGSIPGFGISLGEGMATHCSILAWRTPWREEPGGLQSTGWQRVRYNWATKAHKN